MSGMNKNILVIVDMQNDFIDGSLGTKEAQEIVPRAVERINKAIDDGWSIYVTQDTHYDNYLLTAEGRKLPVKHCIYGTKGWEIHPEIQKATKATKGIGYYIFKKETFGSIWLAEETAELVHTTAYQESDWNIEFIGLCTDICVISNALLLKAYLPEANISVNASCCAGVTPELHEAALKTMASCQINII